MACAIRRARVSDRKFAARLGSIGLGRTLASIKKIASARTGANRDTRRSRGNSHASLRVSPRTRPRNSSAVLDARRTPRPGSPLANCARSVRWLTMIFAALTMRKLAEDWLPARAALMAGLVYALNPYLMVTAYTRCAYAELLASAIFPLLLWG